MRPTYSFGKAPFASGTSSNDRTPFGPLGAGRYVVSSPHCEQRTESPDCPATGVQAETWPVFVSIRQSKPPEPAVTPSYRRAASPAVCADAPSVTRQRAEATKEIVRMRQSYGAGRAGRKTARM